MLVQESLKFQSLALATSLLMLRSLVLCLFGVCDSITGAQTYGPPAVAAQVSRFKSRESPVSSPI